MGSSDAHGAAKFIGAACVLRLVVLPALCLPLHLGLIACGMLPRDPALLMICTISVGTPSAQTLVLVLNAIGATRVASEASKVYVPMYALSVISTSCIIFAVCIVAGDYQEVSTGVDVSHALRP